jgi:hypothetical protein
MKTFDYWKHSFDQIDVYDIYENEFFEDYHENYRIESYLSKLSPINQAFSFIPKEYIQQEHPFLIEKQKKLVDMYHEYKSSQEFLSPIDKSLKVSKLKSKDIDFIDELFYYIMHDLNLFEEDYYVDPFYGHYYQYYKSTELPYQWHKFPTISPDYVHIRMLVLLDIEKSTTKESMKLFYKNIVHHIKPNTYIPIISSEEPYSIVLKSHAYLLLSFGIQLPIRAYIKHFVKKNNTFISLIRNEKLINRRLKMQLNKNTRESSILFRDTIAYLPLKSKSSLCCQSYICSIPNIIESYIRALMSANYTVNVCGHHSLLFQSIPHTLLDDHLKNLIKNTLTAENIKYQSYDINFGLCYTNGAYLFQKMAKYVSCKKIIVFVEKGSTETHENYIYQNQFIHSYTNNNYYVFNNELYGFTHVHKGYNVFMELIPI